MTKLTYCPFCGEKLSYYNESTGLWECNTCPANENYIEELEREKLKGIIRKIEDCSTRTDALNYIKDLKLSKAELIEIAKECGILGKGTKNQLIDKIIEQTVGAKLKFKTLLEIQL